MEFPWNDSLPSRRMRDRKRGTLHVQGRVPRVEQAPRDVNLAVRLMAEAESALLVLGLNASAAF